MLNTPTLQKHLTMGMDINVYTKELSPELIPKIQKGFRTFKWTLSFILNLYLTNRATQAFCQLNLKVRPGQSEKYNKIDFDIMTGFELLFSDYDYHQELENSHPKPAKHKSFLSKVFGNNKDVTSSINFVADKELDKLLRDCNVDLTLNWKSWNKSELRISLFFAAILAELTDGVIYDPQNGRYLSGQQALAAFPLKSKISKNPSVGRTLQLTNSRDGYNDKEALLIT